MKKISISYLSKKINKLNKKIHRAEDQNEENKGYLVRLKNSLENSLCLKNINRILFAFYYEDILKRFSISFN